MLYTDFLFTISTEYILSGLFCFVVWSIWGFAFGTWQMLTQFSLVAFYKKKSKRSD